jgi:flagellar biosynthesis/type III secretory pathway M-ring protein FliF/YscJ
MIPSGGLQRNTTTYIIIGAVVLVVLFVLMALITFALIMVINRRHLKRKDSQAQGSGKN